MQPTTLYEAFEKVAKEHSDKAAFRFKENGRWTDVSWGDHRQIVRRVSRALLALGVRKEDRVCILAATCLRWVQIDSAIVNIGGMAVGIYPSNLAPDCAYILEHCEAGITFVENDDQLQKVLSVRDQLPALRHVVHFYGPSDESRGVLGWDDFVAQGETVPDERIDEAARRLQPDDVAAIVYTSGTTGAPKGAMITHRNLLFTAEAAEQVLYVEPHFVTLLFLPLAHVFARMIAYLCQFSALTVAFAEDITTVPANLKEVRPHFVISVPRIYEKIFERVHGEVAAAGGLRKKLFDWAVGVGTPAAHLRLDRRPIPLLLGWQHALADRLVLRKVRSVLGGRVVWAASGAAPLNVSIAEFFHAVGVWVIEGLGMTENTSLSNANLMTHTKLGSVGPAVPGVEMRTAEDGEVLFRGENVMKGYFKNPEATAETIDPDGWLHTGDIGEIDEDGFLRITDRKKDLIITAGGKNIAPQRIEKIMRSSPYISQLVAFGDRRKYITALVTLALENVVKWAAEQGIASDDVATLAEEPRVRALIEKEIAERNRQLASFETIKKFRILPRDLSIEDGDLTPTLKVKRRVVAERHRELIESMYDEPPAASASP